MGIQEALAWVFSKMNKGLGSILVNPVPRACHVLLAREEMHAIIILLLGNMAVRKILPPIAGCGRPPLRFCSGRTPLFASACAKSLLLVFSEINRLSLFLSLLLFSLLLSLLLFFSLSLWLLFLSLSFFSLSYTLFFSLSFTLSFSLSFNLSLLFYLSLSVFLFSLPLPLSLFLPLSPLVTPFLTLSLFLYFSLLSCLFLTCPRATFSQVVRLPALSPLMS